MGANASAHHDESPSPETRLLSKDTVTENEEKKVKYPKSVFFIMGNEFCERFSYYGMRTVLTLYLTNILLFNDDKATVIYHVFTMLCYFTPLLGAIISDSYLGKFKTIFYISIIYAIGNIVISIASIPDLHLPLLATSVLGLLLIGLGTGGIKPCVSAFGGDQFVAGQEKQRQQFFSLFYFCINAGSLISTFLTPVLRAKVKCFGADTCYPLAFGVPAILMIIALILFLLGRPFYKIYSPEGNVLVDVAKISGRAIRGRFSNGIKREHWLDHADDKFEKKLIEDVKALYRVLWMFLPLPFFWALFDQQGSRWTLQANKMDGDLGFINFTVQPDQIQVLNPILIIAFIPFTEMVLYPLLKKCGVLNKPLQRMCFGGLLASFSFILAALVEITLEKTLPVPPAVGTSEFTFINSLPCTLKINLETNVFEVPPLANYTFTRSNLNLSHTGLATFSGGNISECPHRQGISGSFVMYPESEKAFTLALGTSGDSIVFIQGEESRHKADKGKSDVRFVYNLLNPDVNTSIMLHSLSEGKDYLIMLSPDGSSFGVTNYTTLIEPDEYVIHFEHTNSSLGRVKMSQGGVYTIILYEAKKAGVMISRITTIEPNTLSMFLQVPQYIVITFAEIMFSITGLEFSYSQAPNSMKSVLQAMWLLTVAFGNLIVVIIAEAEIFSKQYYEFFLFAGLMAVDMVIFAVMAYYYVYTDPNKNKPEPTVVEQKATNEKGETNLGFEDDTKM